MYGILFNRWQIVSKVTLRMEMISFAMVYEPTVHVHKIRCSQSVSREMCTYIDDIGPSSPNRFSKSGLWRTYTCILSICTLCACQWRIFDNKCCSRVCEVI